MGYSAELSKCKFQVKSENFGKVFKRLTDYGYEPEVDDEGNVTGLDFIGDKVAFGEDAMFSKIAPFVESGSFIEMQGEDGNRWRWIFKDGKVHEIKAKMTWPDDE